MVSLLLQHGEYECLANLTCNPLHYQDHQHFADDYLATNLMKKSPNLPLAIDKHDVALKAFWSSEEVCRETNERLFAIPRGGLPPKVEQARTLIHNILGPLTIDDLRYVEDHFRFGPGATTSVTGVGSVTSDKYDAEMHLTSELYPFYKAILGQAWWDHTRPTIVEGNKFTSVPKTALTNRGICVEPHLNIFVQLGIGALLRKRLRRLGVDLTDQTRNQEFARRAYRDGLATIDLSKASDSVAYATVICLLPPDWVQLLEIARSPATFIAGEYVTLEKFSSMGNGYTFELESLIFAALAHVCNPGQSDDIAVYGDDIIVPAQGASCLIEALESLGFKVNESKSFLAGNFFESCGRDFFQGIPVRPFFLKKEDGTHSIPYALQFCNALRLYLFKNSSEMGCDERFRPVWLWAKGLIPKPWSTCTVPPKFGDQGLIVSRLEIRGARKPRKHNTSGLEGIEVRHVKCTTRDLRKETLGRHLYALSQAGHLAIATNGFEPRRGLYGRFVLGWALVDQWPEGLEWTKLVH
jgi:hypothetical protein